MKIKYEITEEEAIDAFKTPNGIVEGEIIIKNHDMKCENCGKIKPDVSHRANAYANDVGNDPTAMHTVCNECDYQNRMDI